LVIIVKQENALRDIVFFFNDDTVFFVVVVVVFRINSTINDV